ncbi:hypothetical protein ABMY26_36595 (plasmid) [Azospirillum sp. HJ39]|uniref:hypothetical protein n=1 Tax=Azospirillum sp. HJ39 TaxID=3159496 RepID=UPI00355689EE
MPVFGNFRMASANACAVDPHAANVTFRFRGNGASGGYPTISDAGGVTWAYPDPARSSLSNAQTFWPNIYATSLLSNGNGTLCNPVIGHINTPYGPMITPGTNWSWMARIVVPFTYENVASYIKMLGKGTVNLFDVYNTMGRIRMTISYQGTQVVGFDYTWPDPTGAGGVVSLIVPNVSFSSPSTPLYFELLITRSGNNTYFFSNGVLVSSSNTGMASGADIATTKIATGCDTNGGGGSAAFYLNDETIWNSCITTTSYTPAILPPC